MSNCYCSLVVEDAQRVVDSHCVDPGESTRKGSRTRTDYLIPWNDTSLDTLRPGQLYHTDANAYVDKDLPLARFRLSTFSCYLHDGSAPFSATKLDLYTPA